MISALSDWLKHLVVLILLAVFLDMVLPSTSMQRYARTVLGLIVMLAMLAPLQALINSHFNIGLLESQLTGPLVATSPSVAQATDGVQTFRNDLASTLVQEVHDALGIQLDNVSVLTAVKADGTPVVEGVTANLSTIGVNNPESAAQAAKLQIATLLGLSQGSVTIVYPGGQA